MSNNLEGQGKNLTLFSAKDSSALQRPLLIEAGTAPPSVLDYISIVWKFRTTLLVLLVASIAGASALSLRMMPTYRGMLQLEVQELNQNFLNVRELDPSPGPNASAPDSYIQVQAQVLHVMPRTIPPRSQSLFSD
jgi:hypothetical protein